MTSFRLPAVGGPVTRGYRLGRLRQTSLVGGDCGRFSRPTADPASFR